MYIYMYIYIYIYVWCRTLHGTKRRARAPKYMCMCVSACVCLCVCVYARARARAYMVWYLIRHQEAGKSTKKEGTKRRINHDRAHENGVPPLLGVLRMLKCSQAKAD